MTTKNKPIRKKPKSNTPIIFKVAKEQQEAIKKPPRISLRRFIDGVADATDWYNIAFRISVGINIAQSDYVQETVDAMKECFNVCEDIFTNAKQETAPVWSITNEQAEYLQEALDAVDTMQDETTRRVQLDAHLIAKKKTSTYVKEFDEYLRQLKRNEATVD